VIEPQPSTALKHIFLVYQDQGQWIIEIDSDKVSCGFAIGTTINEALDNAKEVILGMNGSLN
jgi:predicted RNase H-like HicB family nuclease